MAMYYNGRKVRNLYYNGKCITRLALGKEMTRLIEGDDFVRAEWLKGDGSAYILTSFIPDDTCGFYIRTACTKISSENQKVIGAGSARNDSRWWVDFASDGKISIGWNTFTDTINFEKDVCYEITNNFLNSRIGTIDGTVYRTDYPTLAAIELHAQIFNGSGNIFAGDISNVKLSKGSNVELNLVPCRLLRPIPATLDGNGIARNAGDCGMFDAVSGKFYGNVANNGNFTVSDN